MDANMRFVIEMMESHRKEQQHALSSMEKRLSEKIDVLWGFRLKIMGASMVASGLASGLVTFAIKVLKT